LETVLIVSSVLLWVVVLLNILLTLALVRRVNASSGSLNAAGVAEIGPTIGEQAPAFSGQTLEGAPVTLESYTGRGRATMLLFISANCQPCRELLTTLGDLLPGAQQTGTDLILVSSDEREQARALLTEFHLDIPVLLAPRESNPFFADYNITGTPSYCMIDDDGTVQSTGHPLPGLAAWKALTAAWTRAGKLAASGRR
jgi:methylamine dehydrogenase accessory protein MauD